jgi:hypothetical protein
LSGISDNFLNELLLQITALGSEIKPALDALQILDRISRFDEARDWLRREVQADGSFLAMRIGSSQLIYPERPAPEDILKQVIQLARANPDSVILQADAADILSLHQIVQALGYAKGQVVIEQIEKTKRWVTFGSPRFHFTKRDGTSVRLEQLSFGEQRLFGFYYYLAATSDVVIADELTNGLHHEMVSGCMAAIGQRQAFLATQNPLLLDHLQFASIAEVRGSFVLCQKELIDGDESMAFRQLGEDEASEFFGHYQAESKQVNAILRWLGLW